MYIKNKEINIYNRPFIIAEISGNHKGSLKRALQIIKEAHKAGVSAIKLQTFDLQEMTIRSEKKDFVINDKKSLWYKKSYTIFTKLLKHQRNGITQYLSYVKN